MQKPELPATVVLLFTRIISKEENMRNFSRECAMPDGNSHDGFSNSSDKNEGDRIGGSWELRVGREKIKC